MVTLRFKQGPAMFAVFYHSTEDFATQWSYLMIMDHQVAAHVSFWFH